MPRKGLQKQRGTGTVNDDCEMLSHPAGKKALLNVTEKHASHSTHLQQIQGEKICHVHWNDIDRLGEEGRCISDVAFELGGHLWAIKIQPGVCSAEGMDVSTAWNGAQPATFSMGMTAGSDPAAEAAAAATLKRHCGCAAMEGVEDGTEAATAAATAARRTAAAAASGCAGRVSDVTNSSDATDEQQPAAPLSLKALRLALARSEAEQARQHKTAMVMQKRLQKLKHAQDLMQQMDRLIDKRNAAIIQEHEQQAQQRQTMTARQTGGVQQRKGRLTEPQDLGHAVSTGQAALKVIFQELGLRKSTTISTIQSLRDKLENQLRKLYKATIINTRKTEGLRDQLQQKAESSQGVYMLAGKGPNSRVAVVWLGAGSEPQGICTSEVSGGSRFIRASVSCSVAVWPEQGMPMQFSMIKGGEHDEPIKLDVEPDLGPSAYTLPFYLNHARIRTATGQTQFLKDDTLTLRVRMNILCIKHDSLDPAERLHTCQPAWEPASLIELLQMHGGDPVFAPDIMLVFFKGAPQEAHLGVHSFMLCGRCPGLEHASIQQQLQATGLNSSTAATGAGGPQAAHAGQQQATELSLDTDPQATYGVLCWLYSGELPAVWQQASQADKAQLLLKVLQLAVAWEMRPLMEVLQRQLSEVLTVGTASYALMLAEHGRLRRLKGVCLSLMAHTLPETMATPGWAYLCSNGPRLLPELEAMVMDNLSIRLNLHTHFPEAYHTLHQLSMPHRPVQDQHMVPKQGPRRKKKHTQPGDMRIDRVQPPAGDGAAQQAAADAVAQAMAGLSTQDAGTGAGMPGNHKRTHGAQQQGVQQQRRLRQQQEQEYIQKLEQELEAEAT